MEWNKRRKGTYKYIKYPDNEGRGNCIKFRALFPFGAFCLFFLSEPGNVGRVFVKRITEKSVVVLIKAVLGV